MFLGEAKITKNRVICFKRLKTELFVYRINLLSTVIVQFYYCVSLCFRKMVKCLDSFFLIVIILVKSIPFSSQAENLASKADSFLLATCLSPDDEDKGNKVKVQEAIDMVRSP